MAIQSNLAFGKRATSETDFHEKSKDSSPTQYLSKEQKFQIFSLSLSELFHFREKYKLFCQIHQQNTNRRMRSIIFKIHLNNFRVTWPAAGESYITLFFCPKKIKCGQFITDLPNESGFIVAESIISHLSLSVLSHVHTNN